MFLPVLLVRDFGMAGFVAFAVPNVLGAAAMGWVLVRRETALHLVRRHAIFVGLFSIVTIAFHVFFLVWVTQGLWLLPGPWGLTGVLLVMLMMLIVASLNISWQRVLAALIVVATAVAAAIVWVQGDGGTMADGGVDEALALARLPRGDAAMFLAVSIFGFALCPYLDVTFNRARAGLGVWPARWAFSLGFGVFFLGMILITLAYSGLFLGQGSRWAHLVAVHIFVQAAFTVGVHLRSLAGPMMPVRLRGTCIAATIVGSLVVLGATVLLRERFEAVNGLHALQQGAIGAGETIYRAFMGFYGLAFPAYVWICMVPGRGGSEGPSRAHLRVWGLAVGIALPMFWMAFIERQTWWIIPALVLVLASKALTPAMPQGRSHVGADSSQPEALQD